MTLEELKTKLDSLYYTQELHNVLYDLKEIYMWYIRFNLENYTFDEDGFDMPGFIHGYKMIGDIPVCWFGAGGDWEMPIAFLVFPDKDGKLKAYLPDNGNCYNRKINSAYGNEIDESEMEDMNYNFNMNDMENEFLLSIKKNNQ